MAMTCRNNIKRDSFIMSTIDELVPQDHLVRKLERGMDLSFIYEKVVNVKIINAKNAAIKSAKNVANFYPQLYQFYL